MGSGALTGRVLQRCLQSRVRGETRVGGLCVFVRGSVAEYQSSEMVFKRIALALQMGTIIHSRDAGDLLGLMSHCRP